MQLYIFIIFIFVALAPIGLSAILLSTGMHATRLEERCCFDSAWIYLYVCIHRINEERTRCADNRGIYSVRCGMMKTHCSRIVRAGIAVDESYTLVPHVFSRRCIGLGCMRKSETTTTTTSAGNWVNTDSSVLRVRPPLPSVRASPSARISLARRHGSSRLHPFFFPSPSFFFTGRFPSRRYTTTTEL